MDKHIIKDETWGYYRIDPLPSKEELDAFYENEFYNQKANQEDNVCSLEQQKQDKEFFETKRERVYDYCRAYFGDGRQLSLLDIGCGFAQSMLYFKKKGFRVSGIDVSSDSVEYARSEGLDAYQVNVEEMAEWNKERFDVVTLFHVFEHIRKPAEAILNIRKHFLKPGGLLVIDLPNEFNDFQLAANEEYKLNSWWVEPPVHINYFSKESFEHVLKRCGYEICQMYADFPMDLFLLMGDVYVNCGEIGKQCHQKRKNFERVLLKQGKKDALNRFYEGLAKLGLGRNLLSFSTYH